MKDAIYRYRVARFFGLSLSVALRAFFFGGINKKIKARNAQKLKDEVEE